MIPLLPATVAGLWGASDWIVHFLFYLGGPIALLWFGYVAYQKFIVVARDLRRVREDRDALARGEVLPLRCPECGEDLPVFTLPNDGFVYRFDGWNCEHCDSHLDDRGRLI